MSDQIVLTGDSLEILKDFPDNSIDSVVTDPPYGLSFMGKKWDYDVPSKELWEQVLRVLKPGGYLLSFGGTRTYHRMVVAIEDAGFEIRDQIQWIYGSGFPKSHNLEGAWEGWGTALKPANEPIVLARKPLQGTVAANVAEHGTGALNIDASRIEATDQAALAKNWDRDQSKSMEGDRPAYGKFGAIDLRDRAPAGRWPANVLFDEQAAEALDAQSGPCKSGGASSGRGFQNEYVGGTVEREVDVPYAKDKGSGASRFFYVAKASKRERNAGLEGMREQAPDSKGGSNNTTGQRPAQHQNNHPTVKPIALMEYLVRLVTPPGGTVLDPFAGSGTTGCAAANLGFAFVGVERETEYAEIARKRIEHYQNKEKKEAV